MKLWWYEKGYSGGREEKEGEGGRKEGGRDTNSQVTLASLLEGKTQNSEVLILGLHSLLNQVKKSTRLRREGGREGKGREGETTNSTSCGFPTGPAS